VEGVGREGWFERVGLQRGVEHRDVLWVLMVDMYSKYTSVPVSFPRALVENLWRNDTTTVPVGGGEGQKIQPSIPPEDVSR
jgi:hypothetical protein